MSRGSFPADCFYIWKNGSLQTIELNSVKLNPVWDFSLGICWDCETMQYPIRAFFEKCDHRIHRKNSLGLSALERKVLNMNLFYLHLSPLFQTHLPQYHLGCYAQPKRVTEMSRPYPRKESPNSSPVQRWTFQPMLVPMHDNVLLSYLWYKMPQSIFSLHICRTLTKLYTTVIVVKPHPGTQTQFQCVEACGRGPPTPT